MQINGKILDYYKRRKAQGFNSFVLQGGRRSGKTYTICQILTLICYNACRIVSVASMTGEQGRLGAYADFSTIIRNEPLLSAVFEIMKSPMEIRNKFNGSKIFFKSYSDSETAKGIACDYLYINEANKFTKQHYTDLMANVRKGVFLDFNPNCKFWVDDYFTASDILITTWKDNPFLTPMQLQYFEELKRLAELPNANTVDIRNYKIYYLGEYSELTGKIFMPDNIHFVPSLPDGLRNFITFSDPSALRGADYFANVLSAADRDCNVYIIDTFSPNEGSKELVAKKLYNWCEDYDVHTVYVETNGIIGVDFHEFALNSGLPVAGWYSRGNKFERIVANYQNITTKMFILDTPNNREYMQQVYEFDKHCEHDDNIDALSSTFNAHRFLL